MIMHVRVSLEREKEREKEGEKEERDSHTLVRKCCGVFVGNRQSSKEYQ